MEKETKVDVCKSKSIEKKVVTAALASTLFLSGCQATVDEVYSDSKDYESDPIGEVTGINMETNGLVFSFAEGYDSRGVLLKDEVIEGPAIIKKNPDTNDIVVIYSGQEYRVDYGVTWKYEDHGLPRDEALEAQTQFFGEEGDIHIRRIGLKTSELVWTGDYRAIAGTEIEGPVLVETDRGWIRVYEGEKYVLRTSGNVNTYEGNDDGLAKEYNRVVKESESK